MRRYDCGKGDALPGLTPRTALAWHLYIWDHHYTVLCAAGRLSAEVLVQSSGPVQGKRALYIQVLNSASVIRLHLP